MSTKLKLLGVDVASFGDAMGATEGALEVVFNDPVAGTYAKLVVSDDAKTLLGGILVGDATPYALLKPMVGGHCSRRPGGADRAGRRRTGVRNLGAARRCRDLLLQRRHQR